MSVWSVDVPAGAGTTVDADQMSLRPPVNAGFSLLR